eukprot:Sspe_Gene.70559::Locus_41665_Transcript_1_1_Confidence_1.000_Length_1360::g.70559::m.70559/K06276/PDPK1; 3-phosphoinositide dependent protein kinase-1
MSSPAEPQQKKLRWSSGDFDIDMKTPIGDGAYATVYKGVNKHTKEEVAVKVMQKTCSSKQSSFVNIELERDIMLTLDHPNIVNLVAHWERDSKVFFVLEFCGGGELFKYMQKYDLSHMPMIAPHFVGEMVLALEYLQGQKVLHRDLKPENILLTSDFHVKVADFGTACRVTNDAEVSKFTGTAQYMAPELLKDGGGRACYESDLWALGCIIYQLFTGHPPFGGSTNYLIFQNILENNPDYPPVLSENAKDLIAELLQHKPEKRLGSPARGGFAVLKQHVFFKNVNWTNLHQMEVKSHVHHNHSKDYASFLLSGEEVVYASEVIKTRHLISKKKRNLVLTNYPRLFYVEPGQSVVKDHVEWSEGLYAEPKSRTEFKVVTKNRVYDFEDLAGHAHLWSSKINHQVVQCVYQMSTHTHTHTH